jgi:hypothetical protein
VSQSAWWPALRKRTHGGTGKLGRNPRSVRKKPTIPYKSLESLSIIKRSVSPIDYGTSSSYHIPTMSVSVEKVSVAIGREELEWARGRAEKEGTSLSAVLTHAARTFREHEARRAHQDAAWWSFMEWATEGEGLPTGMLEAAQRELRGE